MESECVIYLYGQRDSRRYHGGCLSKSTDPECMLCIITRISRVVRINRVKLPNVLVFQLNGEKEKNPVPVRA